MYYGPEFIAIALNRWAYDKQVVLDFSRPGRPTDNAFIESFNGSLRDECLASIGLCHLKTHRKSLKTGDKITIVLDRIHRWGISRQRCLPSHFAVQPHRRFF